MKGFRRRVIDDHPGYGGQQALLFGVVAVMVAALFNLLPWFLALRGTPEGQAQALVERRLGRIQDLEEEIRKLRAGQVYTRGGGAMGKPGKGYRRVPITGRKRDFMIGKRRRQIAEIERQQETPAFRAEMARIRAETTAAYAFFADLNWPATLILQALQRPVSFTRTEVIDNLGARLRMGVLVLVCWMPMALLLGLVLGLLKWRWEAHQDLEACAAESRLAVRSFLILEISWLILYIALYTVDRSGPIGERSRPMAWLLSSIWLVKLVQQYLVLRGCLALRVPGRRLTITGILGGALLLHWLAFLMIYEEFNHVRELIAARHATARVREERERLRQEEAEGGIDG